MKWPWQTPSRAQPLTLAYLLDGQELFWLLADCSQLPVQVQEAGSLSYQAADPTCASRMQAIYRTARGAASQAIALLPVEGYQLLQADMPAVPAEELRAAVRWQIRDRLERHVDDFTIDVLRIGHASHASSQAAQVWVVAALTSEVDALAGCALQAGWPLKVVDIADLAQRNLHTAAALASELAERATACLMQHGEACLLTITIGEELCYSRRLKWDPALAAQAALKLQAQQPSQQNASTLPAEPSLGMALESPGWLAPVELGGPSSPDEPHPLLLELQRSFEVWERSWQDWPLATLWLHTETQAPELIEEMQTLLGLRVQALPLDAAINTQGLDQPLPARAVPLLGALLRRESREL